MLTRREFLEATAVGAAGLAMGTTAKSYERIAGANDRLNFAVIGLNGRAYAHLSSLKANRNLPVTERTGRGGDSHGFAVNGRARLKSHPG